MGRRKRLLAKVFDSPTPPDLTFRDLRATFEHFGGTVMPPSGGGSHYTFAVAGHTPTVVPRHDPVNREYVRNVRDLLAAAGVRP